MLLLIQSIGIALEIITLILHLCGLYFLKCLHQDGRYQIRHVYISFLSATEAIGMIAFLLITILRVASPPGYSTVIQYINIFLFTSVSILVISNIILIVIDKVLEIVLTIRYDVFCDMKRVQLLEGVIVFASMVTSSVGIILYHWYDYNIIIPCALFFRPITNIIFLITTVISYVYIFRKYKQSREPPVHHVQSVRTSVLRTFINSRFFISACHVINYIVFICIPDFLYVFILIGRVDANHMILNAARFILYTISCLCDAYIYVYIDTKVRNVMLNRLRIFGCLKNRVAHEDTTSHNNYRNS